MLIQIYINSNINLLKELRLKNNLILNLVIPKFKNT